MHQLLKKPVERKPFHKRRWVRLTSVVLMLVAAYGLYRAIRPDPNLKKIQQLREEFANSKDWTPEQRQQKGREMREAMQNLSPSQREALAAERQKRAEAEMERYANLTPTEKIRHLDEQITREQKMRQQFAQRNPNGQRPQTAGPNNFGSGQRQSLSAEERDKRRKERLNNTSPEYRARRDQYRKDMAARRQQWGLVPRQCKMQKEKCKKEDSPRLPFCISPFAFCIGVVSETLLRSPCPSANRARPGA
jgi:hypothetical protein